MLITEVLELLLQCICKIKSPTCCTVKQLIYYLVSLVGAIPHLTSKAQVPKKNKSTKILDYSGIVSHKYYIKTHNSESRGQEEAQQRDH